MVTAVMSGPMTVFYGDEWGQEVPNFDIKKEQMGYYDDHVARVNGKFSGFTENESNLLKLFRRLMNLRSNLKSLYMGGMTDIKTDDVLFSIKKDFDDESVFFFMNVREDKTAEVNLDTSVPGDGNSLYDLMTCEEVQAEGNVFKVNLPAVTGKLLGNKTAYSKVCAD